MVEVKIEKWLDNDIRFVKVEDEWHAVAKDVAEALCYNQTPSMIRRIDKDEISTHIMDSTSKSKYARKTQKINVISKLGLYTLLANSRKTKAKEMLYHLEKIDMLEIIKIKTPKQTNFEIQLIKQIKMLKGDKKHLEFKSEYIVPGINYRADLYFPNLNLIVEYDENDHKYQQDKDKQREIDISKQLKNINFIRVKEGEEYQGIIDILTFKKPSKAITFNLNVSKDNSNKQAIKATKLNGLFN